MTTNPSETARVRRFGRAPRWVHWATAAAMTLCLASAAVLYLGPLSVLVGRRQLVETIHVWSGFALPVPMAVGWSSHAFRADARALNRFSPDDWAWLRVRLRARRWRRPAVPPVGKFNAGQKLYAAFVAGAILVMLGTGLLLAYGPRLDLRVTWRTGATFVHDWLALAVAVAIAGHLWMAWRDPVARLGMRTGTVPLWWARRHHTTWVDTVTQPATAIETDTADEVDGADGEAETDLDGRPALDRPAPPLPTGKSAIRRE